MSELADGEILPPGEPQSIPFKSDNNAGIIFWALANATLGAYIAFTLLSRSKEYEALARRRITLIIFAALSLTFSCWACQLSTSRIRLSPPNEADDAPLLGFDPGFVAISICIPIVLVTSTLFLLDLRAGHDDTNRSVIWKCFACSLLVGLSVGFMHYCPFLSLPSFTVTFAPSQVSLVLLLCISGSLFSLIAFTLFINKHKGTNTKLLYVRLIFTSLVFGSCVVGAGMLSHTGMKFEAKDEGASQLNENNRKQRDVLTLAIPAVISVVLACAAVVLIGRSEHRNANTPTPRLILASIAFNHDGRVLVNEKGMLPTQSVSLEGLPENILDELDSSCSTFHWLLAISFDWSIISPFLRRIASISTSPDKRPSLWRSLFCSFRSFPLATPPSFFRLESQSDAVPAQARLKLRLLAAATQLAAQLDVPLEKLGTMHNRSLETGSRIGIAEFLHLSERAASQLRDAEKTLKAKVETSRGLMLFFVRTLPQQPSEDDPHPSPSEIKEDNDRAQNLERDWRQGHSLPGFKMRFMGRFRGALAETTGAKPTDVDRVLNGCKNAATRRSCSVLEPGCTYVSLFAEKISCDGSSEVLVYDFAKHQLPSYKLGLHAFTREMRDWLDGMSGFTASDIIQICKHEVEQGRLHHSLSSRSSHTDMLEYEEEHRRAVLLHFEQALGTALAQLMRDMSFVGESLETWTYLTSHILDVPAAGSSPDDLERPALAHMIVLHAEHPDPLDEDESDFTHPSAHSTRDSTHQAMPSVFEYIPRPLFDVMHALSVSPPAREAFRASATRELERLTDSETSTPNQRTPSRSASRSGPGRLPRALVSSFSIDSLSDEEGGNRSTAARIRKSWAAVKVRVRALKPSPRKSRRVEALNNRIPLSLSHSTSRTQLLSRSHKVSSSTATTSTATSYSVLEPPALALYPGPLSRSTVEFNPGGSARGYSDSEDFVSAGRSRARSISKPDGRRSRWEETMPVSAQIPLPIPPIPFRISQTPSQLAGNTSGNRAAWKSVPNVAATRSGFF